MNTSIRRVAALLMACFVVLFAQLNVIQVVNAPRLNDRADNSRSIERDFNQDRGDIVSADRKLLAHSQPTKEGKFKFQRQYPQGELFAHIVGSYSWIFGSDGVERTYNDELAGQTTDFKIAGINPLSDVPNVGTVQLSLRVDVQQIAQDQLDGRNGSVVAMDPRTGAIIAMYSNPTYDPNTVSDNDSESAKAARALLLADPINPMLARTYREKFAPGSTFKVVTAAAGLEAGVLSPAAPSFAKAKSYTPPLSTRPIANFGKSECGGTLFEITKVSCNSAFAELGAEYVGGEHLVATAERFGFNKALPFDLPNAAAATLPSDFGKELRQNPQPGRTPIVEDTPGLALASIGQGDVAATPLQMVMVASAIANGGTLMVPHVMQQVTDQQSKVMSTYENRVFQTPITSETSAVLRQAMETTAAEGTAKLALIEGRKVGAKTGTAQIGNNESSHAWVIAYAGPPDGPPEIAVAVLVEAQPGVSEQTGGQVAAPIAQRIMRAALVPVQPATTTK